MSKYLRKYVGKNGKMVYVYKESSRDARNGFSNRWTTVTNRNGKDIVTVDKGQNAHSTFRGISLGKGANSRNDYKYREKTIKIGKNSKIVYDNNEGRQNITYFKKKKNPNRRVLNSR